MFDHFDNSVKGALSAPIWRSFKLFELDEIMRQKDDKVFAVALNHLSLGLLSHDEVALFKSREVSAKLIPPEEAVHLFVTNADVDFYNAKYLSKFTSEKRVARAVNIILGTATNATKQILLEHVINLPTQEAQNLPQEVVLAVGAIYSLTANVDVSDGLTNGCTGPLRQNILGEDQSKQKVPVRLLFEFNDTRIGSNARKGELYTPIKFMRRKIKEWPGRDITAWSKQFPVSIANTLVPPLQQLQYVPGFQFTGCMLRGSDTMESTR